MLGPIFGSFIGGFALGGLFSAFVGAGIGLVVGPLLGYAIALISTSRWAQRFTEQREMEHKQSKNLRESLNQEGETPSPAAASYRNINAFLIPSTITSTAAKERTEMPTTLSYTKTISANSFETHQNNISAESASQLRR